MNKPRDLSRLKGASVRCAIYTRKSTEDGLEQEFNSLDAQRESGEAFIQSQMSLGWTCLPEKYDDGGFTGGNMDRPALKRLLAHSTGDVTSGYVQMAPERLRRAAQTVADRMKQLCGIADVAADNVARLQQK